MKEIKCPNCGSVFQVDESGYAQILQQVRDREFEKELDRRKQELEQKKRDAVIRGSERQAAETAPATESTETQSAEGANSSTYSERDGEPLWTQKVVGDVVPIGGKIPVTLETWEHDGHVLLTLRDEAGGIVKSADNGTDKSHTDYQYVYFTMIDLLDNGVVVFTLEGTDDAGMSGNLNRFGQGTVETDQGMTGDTYYYQDWGGSGNE